MKRLTKLIKKTAIHVTDNSVGKSLPIIMYEVKVPEILKKVKKK